MNRASKVRQTGFSLIELAIVLVIIGLLIGGGIVALQATTERQQRAEQRQQLRQINDALYGYAMSRSYLPCPDTSYPPNGEEDRDSEGECDQEIGTLPWATLGVGARDAWGNRLRYRVAENYAAQPNGELGYGLTDGPQTAISVYEDESETRLIAEQVPAIVISFGPDGGRVWADAGFNCPGLSQGFSLEASGNCQEDTEVFYYPGYQRDDGDGGFRQMLSWLSEPVFKARMIEAGHLP